MHEQLQSAEDMMQVTVVFMVNVKTLFDKDWTPVWEKQQAWLKRKKEHDHAERKKAKEVWPARSISEIFCQNA